MNTADPNPNMTGRNIPLTFGALLDAADLAEAQAPPVVRHSVMRGLWLATIEQALRDLHGPKRRSVLRWFAGPRNRWEPQAMLTFEMCALGLGFRETAIAAMRERVAQVGVGKVKLRSNVAGARRKQR